MEETPIVNTPPEVNQPIQTPIENPVPVKVEEKLKKNFGLTVILSFTTIIATLIAGFFYFQNTQLRNELQKNLPSSTPAPTSTPDETADWKVYKDENNLFELKYPSFLIPDDTNKNIFYLSGYEPNEQDTFVPNLAFGNLYEKGSEFTTLSEWILSNEKIFSNPSKIDTETINNNNFVSFESDSGPTAYAKHYLIINGENIFDFLTRIPGSNEEISNQLLDLLPKILSTLKFNEENKINCASPRPEVCTEECIANPPYICGSDGESYCTTCQACANINVEWYEMKNISCGEK